MFVNTESADNAMQILQAMFDELHTIQSPSDLETKLLGSVKDVINELAPKPFQPYSDIATAVANYVSLRDMLGIERKSWEDHEKDVKFEQDRISMFLRDKGDEMGVDSFATPSGTAYRNVKTSYRIEDWDKYATWLLATNNLQCLEKRPAKLAVKEIHDETGDVPPGLILYTEVEFNVRRPTKRSS